MAHKEKIASNPHRKIYPLDFYRKFLDKNVRPDGRHLTKCRATSIKTNCISTAAGSAVVKIGSTTVTCGIKLEIAAPRSPHVKEGFVEIDVILDPLCALKYHSSNKYEQDCHRHEAAALSRSLCDIVLTSGMFSLENLCIESEKFVWVLYCDLLCVCNDGNLFDACLLSIVSALKTLKIPHTCIGKNDDAVYIDNRNANSFYKLSIKYDLLPLSFGILDKKIIVDPTIDEEELLSDVIHVVLNNEGELIHLHKSGEKNIDLDMLQFMIDLATQRANRLIGILNQKCVVDASDIVAIDFRTELPEEEDENDSEEKEDKQNEDETDHPMTNKDEQ